MTRRTLAFLSAFVLAAAPSVAMAGGPAKPPKATATAAKPKAVTTKVTTTKVVTGKVKPVTSVKTTHGQTKLAKPPKAAKTTTVKATKTKAVKASVKPAKTEKSKSVKTATTVEAKTTTGATESTTTTSTTSPGDTVALTDVQQKLKRNTNLASKLQSRLPAGTDLMKAAYGFKNLGQFVAAVNTSYHDGIPFAQLKRKMVREGMSLGQAKQALRPSSATSTTGGQL